MRNRLGRDIRDGGFTLLEILLVIVMIAITSAMVVPSLYQTNFGSTADELKRLQMVMRAALEESQWSNTPIRWVAHAHGWHFEIMQRSDDGMVWVGVDEPPLEVYELPDGMAVDRVEQAGEFVLDMQAKAENVSADVARVGMVLFLPDGLTSQSDVYFNENSAEFGQFLQVRPGPAGIKISGELP